MRGGMRGGMNIKTIGGFLMFMFDIVKKDTDFIKKHNDVEVGAKQQFDAVNEYKDVLQQKINDPTFIDNYAVDIGEFEGVDLSSVLWYIDQQKDLNSKLDVEIPEEYIVKTI